MRLKWYSSKCQAEQAKGPTAWNSKDCTMSTITSELLNKLLGLDGEQPDNHTEKWKRLRRHFDYLTDEQFADMYRTCFDSDGLTCVSSFKYDYSHSTMIDECVKNLRGKYNGRFVSLPDLMRSTCIHWSRVNDGSFYEHVMKAMRALANDGNYGFECVPMYSSGRAHVYMFRAV